MGGFTVWFDRKGGKEEVFGIKFPIGLRMGERPPMEEFSRNNRGNDESRMQRMPPIDTIQLEILGPTEESRKRERVLSLKGLDLHLTLSEERMVYTLKIPLMDNGADPYAIGTTPGSVIGIGLQTATMEQRLRGFGGEGPGGGGPPGGDEGGGPPGGGPGGGGPPGGGPPGGGPPGGVRSGSQSEPLELWLKVQLPGSGTPGK